MYMEFNGRVYYIVRTGNLSSIMERGILSYNGCHNQGLGHASFALSDVQERRDGVVIPNALPLHDYVCLYFNPRNATLFYLRDKPNFEETCILVIDGNRLLGQEGVVISDRNAATSFASFLQPEHIGNLDFGRIYARSWNHQDEVEKRLHKAEMCSELLVPHKVDSEFILGALTQSQDMSDQIEALGLGLQTQVSKVKFFISE